MSNIVASRQLRAAPSTTRTFSEALQHRRRSTEVMTPMRSEGLVINTIACLTFILPCPITSGAIWSRSPHGALGRLIPILN